MRQYLLLNLKPLSDTDTVNRFLHDNYGEMYTKLRNLSWGPFTPKSFGVFPMIAINHWDEHDDLNSLLLKETSINAKPP